MRSWSPAPLAQAILTFRGAANGEEAPLGDSSRETRRTSEGWASAAVGKVSVDPTHNEIFIANGDNTILVFRSPRSGKYRAEEDFWAGRIPSWKLSGASGTCVRIDAIHNLLLVPTGGIAGGRVLIFDRDASGNTPPKAIIQGPWRWAISLRFGLLNCGWSHTPHGSNIEIWKIPESGVSTEPPLKIPAPVGGGVQRLELFSTLFTKRSSSPPRQGTAS